MRKIMKFLFAAGGTGGHIFPALAMAEEVRFQHPSAEVLFVGTPRGLESQLIPERGFKLELIKIGRLNKNVGILERVKTLFLLPWALIQSFLIIIKFKPDAVVGVGGYASGPILLASALLGKKCFIWEPNAFPGMANRYLARFVRKAYIVFEISAKFMKVKTYEVVGYPLRKEFDAPVNLQGKFKAENLSSNLRVFIFGGSQGAKSINDVMAAIYRDGSLLEEGFEFVHQAGSSDYERLVDVCSHIELDKRKQITLSPFINNMVEKYKWADIAICRAGMGTVSELAAMGVPAIFVPLPNSADDHQVKNAEALVSREASIMILQKDLDFKTLMAHLRELGCNKNKLKKLSENISKFHEEKACAKIVKSIVSEILG